MKRWLILDVHFLCHRAFHTMGRLEFEGERTGVTFGFLKSISFLKDELVSDRVVFCFESARLKRRDLMADYKRRRHTRVETESETLARLDLKLQIKLLRTKWLPMIGFKNLLCVPGYESDDLMASIAKHARPDEDVILVTSDSDMLQCLRPNVSMYDPTKRKLITDEKFKTAHGYAPDQWALVKAMAGCSTDGVPGIGGIGIATAEKIIKNELSLKSAAWRKYASIEGRKAIRKNLALVGLPFMDCPNMREQLVHDEIDERQWSRVCAQLGFRSIAHTPPIATRKMRQQELL